MKKTIITSMALASLAAGVLLYSCKKQETILPQKTITSLPQVNEVNVSVKNDLLVFKTKKDYRSVADNPSSEQKIKFVDNVKSMNSFSSYYKYFSANKPSALSDTSAIDNDFLQVILNKDAAVQIGAYIYKIDVKKEKVFALDTAHASQYSDVVSGNTANSNVRAFSIGDDVLSLTGNAAALGKGNGLMNYEDDGGGGGTGGGSGGGGSGGGGGGGIFCSQSGIGDQESPTTIGIFPATTTVNGSQVLTTKKISGVGNFKRYGVYFELNAKVLVEINASPNGIATWVQTNDQVGITVQSVYYHVRCGTTVGPYDTYTASGGGGEHKFLSYSGSRNLNEVWLRTKFNCEGMETGFVELRQNY